MIKINNSNIDLVIQCEEHAKIQNVFNLLTLDITDVMIICPELFLQRFVQSLYNLSDFENNLIERVEESLQLNNGYMNIGYIYKGKEFTFHLIITGTSQVIVNNPFKGDQVMNVGFKKINI